MRLYCGLLLLLETAVNGALCATDLVLFLLFFAMQAVPLYLLHPLLRRAPGASAPRRARGVAVLVSAALLLVGFLLVVVHSGAHSSDLTDLSNAARRSPAAVGGGRFLARVHRVRVGFVDRAAAHLGARRHGNGQLRRRRCDRRACWCDSPATG